MRCTTIRRWISPYIDGELSKKELDLFESHIKTCKACIEIFEGIRNTHDLFSGAPRFTAPYGFSTRVIANLAEQRSEKRLLIPFFTKSGEALLVVAVVVLGIAAGNVLFKNELTPNSQTVASFFSLDAFAATPSDSVGGAYLAMMEGR